MMTVFQRLQRLVAVAAIVAAALTATESFAGEAAEGAKFDTMPMTIVNNSGYRGKMFVFIYGMDEELNWYRVINKAGDVAPFPDTSAHTAYGIKFKNKKKARIRLPELISARVYISYGKKLKFSSPGAEPSPPEGWSASDKNYKTLFDRFEYDWIPESSFFDWGISPSPKLPANSTYLIGRLTQVDMIGIPMLYTVKGVNVNNKPTKIRVGFDKPGARDKILTRMRDAGHPWKGLLIADGRNGPLRAISPYDGIGAKIFPANQLDSYIDQVWSKYASSTMTAVLQGDPVLRFTGKVSGGELVFTAKGPDGFTIPYGKPTTMQLYGERPSIAYLDLDNMLKATFMRSTILADGDISACPDPAVYYKNTPVNMYAKILHKHAYQHKAYAFGFDNECDQASDSRIFNPTSLTLKIPKFERKKRR